jgi:putative redox protein
MGQITHDRKDEKMDAKVVWKQKMSFDGSSESGFTVPLGTSPAVGGDDDGFRPMELIAIGLAGCTAMDVVSILSKKRQEITSFEVQVHTDRAAEHPMVFTHIVIEYIISGKDLSEDAVKRAVQLSEEKYCPAQAMFKKVAPMELKITIQ